jgi:1-acyl-sn-glycerol-3-phosphate acyltransferase
MIFFVGLAPLLKVVSGERGRRRVVRLTRILCLALMRILAIRCRVDGLEQLGSRGDRPLLILPNHISYVDVVVLNAILPSVFVTSREIEQTPVLGWITRAAGCAFVERRHVWSVQSDIVQIADVLNRGHSVTLFLEGSTSDGERLLEFKKSLLEAALRSSCRVIPICLEYERVSEVAWYGDMTFFPHLWRLMRSRTIEARVSVLSEVAFRTHKSRKLIAREVRTRIAERFHRESSIAGNERAGGAC